MGTGGNVPMIMNAVRAVDQRNISLGSDKSETLHGSGHGSSVGTIIEPMALHITQDPTVFEGKTPCLTQGNPKTGQATVGVAIPIADKVTRYNGGGDTRNNDSSANGLDIGEPGVPANMLTTADRHGVACFAQQAIGEYEESEKASCLKRRDYKDSTDLILWEYIIRRLTPLECCRLQGFPDNWAEELGIPEPTQEDIDHWREVFRVQMEAMGESKKEKTDNQICKWLKDPESDSTKYKMWGNGIALPCAMFVMEGIARNIT